MDSIVGIFDLDTSTISKFTRDYLTQDGKKTAKWLTYLWNCQNTFVVCAEKKRTTVYISQISSSTLLKRMDFLKTTETNLISIPKEAPAPER